MTGKGRAKWIAKGGNHESEIERVLAKAKAIGMKLESGAENKPKRKVSKSCRV
jgi:hypothetical protein